jgi:glycerol-3-phosphate dehydrogenase (NAD(P)+)
MADFIVLGAGAMGTAVSCLLAYNNNEVLMWARRKEICDLINKKKQNPEYMPGLIIPESVKATTNLEECVTTASKIVIAIPSHGVYDLCTNLCKYMSSKMSWLSVVKGMDTHSKSRISELLQDKLSIKKGKIAVLSGPNFAIEIMERIPTIAVIGSLSNYTVSLFRKSLMNDYFLIETTDDVNGVEMGGILKNVGAIALGLVDGLNLGDNTRGLVISLYVREALKVGDKVFGARIDTLLGPACLGDMITTAFSNKSRNRVLGLLAAKCITRVPELTFIAEGRNNAEMIKNFADEHKIRVPVTEFVYSVLNGTKPLTAFNNLWRHLREETSKTA